MTIVSEFYDGYASWKEWDRLFTYDEDAARAYAGEMRGVQIKDADLLEIGFGAGGFLAWARDQGARVSGIEVIAALQDAARANGFVVLAPSIEAIAVENVASFDTIVALDVFEHFSLGDLRARLRAIANMLRPNGACVLRFPNAQSPFGLAPQFGDPTHLTGLSRGVIEPLIAPLPLRVARYGNAYRNRGVGLKAVVRTARYCVRDLTTGILGWAYAQKIPWDPVATLVLRKCL